MNWYISVWKKYAVFSGRATRSEYWYFVLINMAISIILVSIDKNIADGGILYTIYSIAIIIPSVAVAARRLHDTDRTGWWQLILFIPIIGFIVLIIFLVQDSKPYENKYGPNPKGLDLNPPI